MTPAQLLNIANDRPLIVVVIDGMHEPPLDILGGLTPWQAADCEAMRSMVADVISLVPEGVAPNTDVALLTLLGYDAGKCANCRAPFEALGLGLDVNKDDIVVRCNLVAVRNGMIVSHCANGLNDVQAAEIVDLLNERFATDSLRFYAGGGFRALLKVSELDKLPASVPPHNILNQPFQPYLISDKTLADINLRANDVLAEGELGANGIWLWGAGKLGCFEPFRYKAASISGTQLVRGISRALGIDVVDVRGADGTIGTNLKGKCEAAISAIDNYRLVLVHVEACDEASHSLDAGAKIEMIKRVDTELIGPLKQFASNRNVSLVVTSDHGTSSVTGRHLSGPVACYLQI